MKGELRQMVAQGSGAIVNCSSIGGIVGSPGRTAYSASKHAIIGRTQSAAFEYANKGVVINAVCPGMVDTPMTKRMTNNYDPEIVNRMISQAPIGRFGRPEEIAPAVVWLCSPGASFTIGHVMAVEWRLSHSIDRLLSIRDVSFMSNPSKRPAGTRGERAKLEARFGARTRKTTPTQAFKNNI
jgi:NAD(P)-dependent dehydrogenase (short-subunit alcohol dehydrogenase family)